MSHESATYIKVSGTFSTWVHQWSGFALHVDFHMVQSSFTKTPSAIRLDSPAMTMVTSSGYRCDEADSIDNSAYTPRLTVASPMWSASLLRALYQPFAFIAASESGILFDGDTSSFFCTSPLLLHFCVSAFGACLLVAGVAIGRLTVVLMELNRCPEDLSSLLCLPEKFSSTSLSANMEMSRFPPTTSRLAKARTRCRQMISRHSNVPDTRPCRADAIT